MSTRIAPEKRKESIPPIEIPRLRVGRGEHGAPQSNAEGPTPDQKKLTFGFCQLNFHFDPYPYNRLDLVEDRGIKCLQALFVTRIFSLDILIEAITMLK